MNEILDGGAILSRFATDQQVLDFVAVQNGSPLSAAQKAALSHFSGISLTSLITPQVVAEASNWVPGTAHRIYLNGLSVVLNEDSTVTIMIPSDVKRNNIIDEKLIIPGDLGDESENAARNFNNFFARQYGIEFVKTTGYEFKFKGGKGSNLTEATQLETSGVYDFEGVLAQKGFPVTYSSGHITRYVNDHVTGEVRREIVIGDKFVGLGHTGHNISFAMAGQKVIDSQILGATDDWIAHANRFHNDLIELSGPELFIDVSGPGAILKFTGEEPVFGGGSETALGHPDVSSDALVLIPTPDGKAIIGNQVTVVDETGKHKAMFSGVHGWDASEFDGGVPVSGEYSVSKDGRADFKLTRLGSLEAASGVIHGGIIGHANGGYCPAVSG